MKQILAYFIVALFISGCPQQATQVSETPSPSSPPATTVSEESTNPQQQALVIGNSEYEYSPLTHSVNDAKEMTNRLKNMGFSVTFQSNLNLQAMTKAIDEFSQRLSDNQASVGLFYFSGYGTQKNEKNFLLPINNDNIDAENDFKQNAVLAKSVIDQMANAHQGMNIIILDACYEEPYHNSNNNTTEGLARMVPPRGTLIAFAAEESQTVSKRKTSLYTKTLVKVLEQAQHNRIEDVFMEVGEQVLQQSDGEQVPWYQASLRKAFCFGGCL